VRKRLLELGAELPSAAEQTREKRCRASEVDKWVPVIKAAGVTGN
jgi:hypothetical protein